MEGQHLPLENRQHLLPEWISVVGNSSGALIRLCREKIQKPKINHYNASYDLLISVNSTLLFIRPSRRACQVGAFVIAVLVQLLHSSLRETASAFPARWSLSLTAKEEGAFFLPSLPRVALVMDRCSEYLWNGLCSYRFLIRKGMCTSQ